MINQHAAWPPGLSEAEAERRRAAGLANEERIAGSTSVARILRRNVFTILNGALFSVSVLLLLMGRYLDALFTAGPVGANVVVAALLELRAKRQLDRLTLIHRPRLTVRRDGIDCQVSAAELVMGDVVRLARGDQAVVDGRVLAGAVEMDESVLSGESTPVVREAGEPILSGSVVVAGSAAVETTHVGGATFASRLAAQARRASDQRTPLRRDLDTLILLISVVTLMVAVPVLLSVAATGEGLLADQQVRAAAVLVALVPQGLAIMATVTYSLAAVRIARAGTIVQRIDATESMSRLDILCLDKTGTITSPTLLLDDLVTPDGVDSTDVRARIGRAASSMEPGNRTVDAIAAALAAPPAQRAHVVAFSSLRRWSGIVLEGDEAGLVFASPDRWPAHAPGSDWVASRVRELSEAGRRVLLAIEVAAGDLAASTGDLPAGRVLAILSLREEIRPDAASTLRELQLRNVRLKLISGDDPRTAAAVARSVGLDAGHSMTGSQVAETADEQLVDLAEQVDVFGRAQPDDKPRIVVALRRRGHHVGMVGDGVNDVLALRRADLGIAMESGSPASRAVAGLVLLGDRFAILPRVITEGQRVVSAMIAVACLLLARTVYMLVLVAAAALLGLPFPFTPTSNAILALVTVGIPIFLLAMWVPPVQAPASVVGRTLAYALPAGLAVSVFVLPVMVVAFAMTDVATGRSIVTAATVFAGLALIPIVFPAVGDRPSPVGPGGDRRPAVMAGAMLILYGLILAVPMARDMSDLVPLPFELLAGLLLATLLWAGVVIALLRTGLPQRLARLSGHAQS